jgi:hypothetical protein
LPIPQSHSFPTPTSTFLRYPRARAHLPHHLLQPNMPKRKPSAATRAEEGGPVAATNPTPIPSPKPTACAASTTPVALPATPSPKPPAPTARPDAPAHANHLCPNLLPALPPTTPLTRRQRSGACLNSAPALGCLRCPCGPNRRPRPGACEVPALGCLRCTCGSIRRHSRTHSAPTRGSSHLFGACDRVASTKFLLRLSAGFEAGAPHARGNLSPRP